MSSDSNLPTASLTVTAEIDDILNDKYFASNIFTVAKFLRVIFIIPGSVRHVNSAVTTIMFCLGIYILVFRIATTACTLHQRQELAMELLTILWGVQSLLSLIFIVYWQCGSKIRDYHTVLFKSQKLAGLSTEHGNRLMNKTHQHFKFLVIFTCAVSFGLTVNFYLEDTHSEFIETQSKVFFFPQLLPFYAVLTSYLHIIWNMALFIFILMTNAAYLEVKYFNEQLENFDGSSEAADKMLLQHLETYSNLCDAIRQLDLMFRLYTFLMLVITITSMVITIMMMNQQIHTFLDFLYCMPAITLCAFSFFAVTIAPARLHDEVSRTKGCLCRNKSIWFPYRQKVYTIGNTLACHMEQFDLGVSLWGFAILSRPLILGTFSAIAMMLSLLAELAPTTREREEEEFNSTFST